MVDIAEARRLARREEHRRQAADVLAEWESEFSDRVAAAFRAVFAPVLDRFGSVIVADAAGFASPDDLATIRGEWIAEVEHTLAPMVSMMFDTGALSALVAHQGATELRKADTVLDLLDDVLDRNAVAYLEQATNRLVAIGDTAWAAARESLVDGFTIGEPVEDLAARVQEALGVAENRAVTIARTEVVSASNAGSYLGVQSLGEFGPEQKQWLATGDARTRESHLDADGQTVGLDEWFTVGGYDLEYPGDPYGPPEEVVNCRCTILYVEAGNAPHDLNAPGRGQGGDPTPLSDEALADLVASTTSTTEEHHTTMSNRADRRHAVRTRSGFTVPPPPERFAPGDTAPAPAVPAAPAADPVVPPAPAPAPAPAPVPAGDTAPPVPAEPGPVDLQVPADVIVRPFEVILAVEGRWTGDDRFVLPGAIRWDGMLPLPVDGNHDETVEQTIGLIGEVFRVPGPNAGENLIVGRGFFDLGRTERPHEAAQFTVDRLESGVVRGASMSIDDETLGGVDPSTVAEGEDPWWMQVVEDARLRAVTVCTVGAFAECGFTLDPEGVDVTNLPPAPAGPVAVTGEQARAIEQAEEDQVNELLDDLPPGTVVVASATGYRIIAAAPGHDAPPADWFADPKFTGPSGLVVTDDGRVSGHLATWGTCHTGFAGQCITAPHSATGYAMFRTGEVVCAGGERVSTGRLTVGTGHASTKLEGWRPAADHYDNTGTAVADVASGEDRFGIWIAGSVRPSATDEQVRTLRASPLSGDWRRIGSSMELVAALAVNSGGFPVPRARVASGVPMALVAANTPAATGLRRPSAPGMVAAAERIARTIGRDRDTVVASLDSRVHH